MSADYSLLYYGIRLQIEDETAFEEYEMETHPYQAAAKASGLDIWYGNFRAEDGEDRYFIFIGAEIGLLGHEYGYELSVADDKLLALMEETRAKLHTAGFTDAPRLLAQFAPDN
jgi:hypothetical protein